MNTTIKVIGGFVVGALAGVAAGLLMAPESGDKTRKKLRKEVGKFADNLTQDMEKKIDHLKDDYNEKIDHLANYGKKGLEKLRESAHVN